MILRETLRLRQRHEDATTGDEHATSATPRHEVDSPVTGVTVSVQADLESDAFPVKGDISRVRPARHTNHKGGHVEFLLSPFLSTTSLRIPPDWFLSQLYVTLIFVTYTLPSRIEMEVLSRSMYWREVSELRVGPVVESR